MEKGYYIIRGKAKMLAIAVAIHNKNGKGLLLENTHPLTLAVLMVAIHNKNGKGLLLGKIKLEDAKDCRNPQ